MLCLFLLCAFAVVVVDILMFDVRGEVNTICLGCWSRPAGWGFIIYFVWCFGGWWVRGEANTICLGWSRPAGWGFIIYFCLMFWWLSMCMMCTILVPSLLLLSCRAGLQDTHCWCIGVDGVVLQCLDSLDIDVWCILHSDGVAKPKPLCPWHLKAIYFVRAGCHAHTWGTRYIDRYDYCYDIWLSEDTYCLTCDGYLVCTSITYVIVSCVGSERHKHDLCRLRDHLVGATHSI